MEVGWKVERVEGWRGGGWRVGKVEWRLKVEVVGVETEGRGVVGWREGCSVAE